MALALLRPATGCGDRTSATASTAARPWRRGVPGSPGHNGPGQTPPVR
ncbi:hypothetical protein [Sorangium cellulosum]